MQSVQKMSMQNLIKHTFFEQIVHTKQIILSLFNHSHVVQNVYDFLSFVQQKRKYFNKCFRVFFIDTIKVSGLIVDHWSFSTIMYYKSFKNAYNYVAPSRYFHVEFYNSKQNIGNTPL